MVDTKHSIQNTIRETCARVNFPIDSYDRFIEDQIGYCLDLPTICPAGSTLSCLFLGSVQSHSMID